MNTILVYLRLLLFIGILIAIAGTPVMAKSTLVDEVVYLGVDRSDIAWLNQYLELDCPCQVTDLQLLEIEEKLLTTQVFMRAKAFIEISPKKTTRLVIKTKEKWTTIPVVRGAFGGGTPLLVAGVYDTHSFGQLWTLGGEFRKYGDAPAGGVLWVRAPRWMGGRYFLNLEVWKDNRIRTIYDDSLNSIGEIDTRGELIRGEFRFPVVSGLNLGLQLVYKSYAPASISSETLLLELLSHHQLALSHSSYRSLSAILRLVYDKISVNNLNYDGSRLLLSLGPKRTEKRINNFWEVEYFFYKLFNPNWNLAFHSLIGSASDTSFQSQYFLGGFDSIRGIPDGAAFGRRTAYGNLELRHIALRLPKFWLQLVGFTDSGFASNEGWGRERWKSSVGAGVRFAIPQVNRLVFRIDYAWSTDGSGAQGITAGMNQFFQPYKPL